VAELVHGTVKNCLCNKVFQREGVEVLGLVANEGEQVLSVLERVHHGSSSDDPGGLTLDGGHPLEEFPLLAETLVGLVQADTVVGLEQVGLADERVVVGEVDQADLGCGGDLHPPPLDDHADSEPAPLELVTPLGDEGLGTEEEGGEEGSIGDEAEDLLCLTEPHVVAEETAGLGAGLAPNHPLDAVDLVGLVLTVGRGWL